MMLANRVKCNCCGHVVESIHPNDWKTCQCGMLEVFGGTTNPGYRTNGSCPRPEEQYVFYRDD